MLVKLEKPPHRGVRVWIANQRIHHGPSGIALALLARHHPRIAIALLIWALSDLHDWKVWFVLGPQPEKAMVCLSDLGDQFILER